MPRETASRRPCSSASYSASLLETLNKIWNTYFNCYPLGEWTELPRRLRRAWVSRQSTSPNVLEHYEVLGFDFPAIQLRSRLVPMTWLLFLAWSWFPRLPVQLPTLKFIEWHPDCGVYPPMGSQLLLRSCTHRNNVGASWRWLEFHTKVSELMDI